MESTKKYIGDLFPKNRFYGACVVLLILFIAAFIFPQIFDLVKVVSVVFAFLVLADYLFLFVLGRQPIVERTTPEKLSNGDENKVTLKIESQMRFVTQMEIVEELPEQFQKRDFVIHRKFLPKQEQVVEYLLRPLERGEYVFGSTNIYTSTLLGFLSRRYEAPTNKMVPVYPSFLQMRKFDLVSQTHLQHEFGTKKMRKLGHSMEFEQIKEYVSGDDVRSINWKATARKGSLMVNNYIDERSQQIYCVIDKGRLMKMPFNGLSLLDYAINSTLVLSNVCLHKQDRVGLVTFSERMGSLLAADRKPLQRENIMQILYNQKTNFLESDFEMLYMQIRNKIKQRSLIVLFTNFESVNGLKRQMQYLKAIAKFHLVLVVFFKNSELFNVADATVNNTEDLYIKTIAEKFAFEKRLIVKELNKVGILTLLSKPEELTIDAINKYLELKSKQLI